MAKQIENNFVLSVFGIIAGWALRRFPALQYAAVAIPSKAGDKGGSGRATMPHDVLLVTAKGGNGADLAKGIEDAVASAIRAADFITAGQEPPRGKIADKYREAAQGAIAAILKEQGLSVSAWVAHLDEFILNAGPQKAQTTIRVNLDPEGINVECRLLLTDAENMARTMKAFPRAVSTEEEGSAYEGLSLADAYKSFMAEEGKRLKERQAAKLAERAEKLGAKLAEVNAELASVSEVEAK